VYLDFAIQCSHCRFNIIKHVLPIPIDFFVRIHGDAHTKKQQLEENDKCKKWVATSERGR